jgi:hypothetical protein
MRAGQYRSIILRISSSEFWLMRQIPMLCRFFTSYLANWWLLITVRGLPLVSVLKRSRLWPVATKSSVGSHFGCQG